jgi:hypothetical protein
MSERYPELRHFAVGYMNQDSDLIADTFEDLVRVYVEEHPAKRVDALCAELERFLAAHVEPADASRSFDAVLGDHFGADFDVRKWMIDLIELLRRAA